MVTVKVPATSANLGSGFDCMGVALQMYNTVSAEETDGGLQIDIPGESGAYLPKDSRNLVYSSMKTVFDIAGYKPRGLHIVQQNLIPVTRGLGSSSASIVGGIVAADALCGAKMSRGDMIDLAAKIEGHPDNTTPALTGGMAIAVKGDRVYYINAPLEQSELVFAVFVPSFYLRTKKARSVLPRTVLHRDAVFNTGRAALLTASVLQKNYDNLKIALEDRLHQPYRKGLIKGVDRIFRKSEQYGALGSYISGAGPSVVSIVRRDRVNGFYDRMDSFIKSQMQNWNLQMLNVDNQGAVLI